VREKYLCIHGHFYQPPRENPWLGIIETQGSARPYHDWNERITRECYAPNARARLLGAKGRIAGLINNYEHISFNYGPTLLSWLERYSPWVYGQILAADRVSLERNQGHGNAMAQVYNHIIMPLANRRDRLTQIRWGRADFRHRFAREPEGMWLAETAADLETLALMAEEGIRFTVLSPDQALKVRPLSSGREPGSWLDVSGGRVDPRRPYRVFTDETRRRFIDVFFYDGPVSRAIAYERILSSGGAFLTRIDQAYGDELPGPRLVNLATDGESYGHHFKFGDMALAWVVNRLGNQDGLKLTNYAAYLDRFPPEYEAVIVENSSWSCAHGVERWRSDCGCHIGGQEGWTQKWRAPLREGLDWLRDEVAALFEERAGQVLKDPWAARDDYVSLLLDRSPEARTAFMKRHAGRKSSDPDRSAALRLLEAQLMSQFMFTSCGWFFDDLAGIEAVQILKYAARAIDLVRPEAGRDLEAGLLEFLVQAPVNQTGYTDGADAYRRLVVPSRIDPPKMTAHYAMRRVIENGELSPCIVSSGVQATKHRRFSEPGLAVAVGEAVLSAETIQDRFTCPYLAIHRGGLGLTCMVAEGAGFDLEGFTGQIRPALEGLAPDRIEEEFAARWPDCRRYSIQDMLPDSRNSLARRLASDIRENFMSFVYDFFQTHQELLRVIEETGWQEPDIPAFIYRLVVGEQLAGIFEAGQTDRGLDWNEVRELAERAKDWDVPLNQPAVAGKAQTLLGDLFGQVAAGPDPDIVDRLLDFLKLTRDLGLDLDLYECQNAYFDLLEHPGFIGDLAPEVRSGIETLGRELGFTLEGS